MGLGREVRLPLALDAREPAPQQEIPYGHQTITPDDVQAVVDTLQAFFLTTGPQVEAFETAVASRVGVGHAVAFSSGTAALHAAAHAAGLGQGDEAITTPMTFCATANCVLYAGARPIFADVEPDTLNLDPGRAAEAVTKRTRAILPVDYAGHPADMRAFRDLADDHDLTLIEDASHALGATLDGRPVGSLADMTVFSFHPVKHITTGEGGMVTTDDAALDARLRRFRNHGIVRPRIGSAGEGDWYYEMVDLGYNYRLSDIACALGRSQLTRLDSKLSRRREIAAAYQRGLGDVSTIDLPTERPAARHAWHLFPIRLEADGGPGPRNAAFGALRAAGIGVNVHYIPVPRHPYYRAMGYQADAYPVAEDAYARLLTLPLWDGMTPADVGRVLAAVRKVCTGPSET